MTIAPAKIAKDTKMTETNALDAPQAEIGATGKVRVWDPLVRVFHWASSPHLPSPGSPVKGRKACTTGRDMRQLR